MKRLLVNDYEEITNQILHRKSIEHEVHVFPKVRLADVFEIEFGVTKKELFNYALKSHFDFLVCDKDFMPLFAVEVDGNYHSTNNKQIKNDKMKNKLCKQDMLPLLRINSNYLIKRFRNTSLLDLLIDIWFLREAFYDAKEKGLVPRYEPFDPYSFFYDGEKNVAWPYDITYELQKQIDRKHSAGEIYHSRASTWIGFSNNEIYYGLAYILVNNNEGIIAKSAMRSKLFPIVESELLASIITYELYDKYLKNNYKLIARTSIEKKLEKFRDKYKLKLSFKYSAGDNYV